MNITNLLKCNINIIKSSNFHTSTCLQVKPENVMKKVMGFSDKKRRKYFDSGILPSATMLSKGSQEGRYSRNARRASVLNKLFMKYITDLMITGEYASEFVDHQIEINKVQITPDFNGLNVFWVAKGTQSDETIEKLLKKNAGYLRHELSSLKVMGVVPTIYFVKDKQFSQIAEVDARLAIADFGDDYVPPELGSKLKSQLQLHIPLPEDIKDKIKDLDEDNLQENNAEDEESLPPMPQDVMGLNYLHILNKIKKNMKQSEAVHRQTPTSNELSLPHTYNENPIEFASNKEQRAAFKSFLQKRELLRSKARQEEKQYQPDIEYIKEEMLQRHIDYFKNMDIYEEENDHDMYLDDENNSVCK